jgi:predicted O-linked N-acetylglucosamine transferase (SPINDLY family)
LKCHQWQGLLDIFNQQKALLKQFILNPEPIKIDFIRQSLVIFNQPSFYIEDNLQENRHLLNQTGLIFQSLFREEFKETIKPYTNNLTANRPLKIGYLGSTFRSHSVGWLCRWLIHYHDQEKYPYYIYSITDYRDQITEEWFKSKATQFYSFDRKVAKVVEQIQQDEIDILIDLDSLTLDLACQILALKPAPIQVTWLGMDATGLPAVDYFIADPYVLPENAQEYYSEKIWRLSNTYLSIDGFEVGVPTLTREDLEIEDDAIIYYNVQNRQKLHPDTIRLQLRILKEVPHSYLLIKERNNKKTAHKFFESLAQEEGIKLNRLRFLEGNKTELEHRANLTIADVMLDTYPYNGATTTLETLWMEIPLVTRVGEQFAARNSYTFMINAGITEGIAWTDEEYIDWGIRLGKDEDLRAKIAWKLRQSKQTSPLWNAKEFTQEMENAYRQMWGIYCQNN